VVSSTGGGAGADSCGCEVLAGASGVVGEEGMTSGVGVAGGTPVLGAVEAGAIETGSAGTNVGVIVMTVLEVRSPPDAE